MRKVLSLILLGSFWLHVSQGLLAHAQIPKVRPQVVPTRIIPLLPPSPQLFYDTNSSTPPKGKMPSVQARTQGGWRKFWQVFLGIQPAYAGGEYERLFEQYRNDLRIWAQENADFLIANQEAHQVVQHILSADAKDAKIHIQQYKELAQLIYASSGETHLSKFVVAAQSYDSTQSTAGAGKSYLALVEAWERASGGDPERGGSLYRTMRSALGNEDLGQRQTAMKRAYLGSGLGRSKKEVDDLCEEEGQVFQSPGQAAKWLPLVGSVGGGQKRGGGQEGFKGERRHSVSELPSVASVLGGGAGASGSGGVASEVIIQKKGEGDQEWRNRLDSFKKEAGELYQKTLKEKEELEKQKAQIEKKKIELEADKRGLEAKLTTLSGFSEAGDFSNPKSQQKERESITFKISTLNGDLDIHSQNLKIQNQKIEQNAQVLEKVAQRLGQLEAQILVLTPPPQGKEAKKSKEEEEREFLVRLKDPVAKAKFKAEIDQDRASLRNLNKALAKLQEERRTLIEKKGQMRKLYELKENQLHQILEDLKQQTSQQNADESIQQLKKEKESSMFNLDQKLINADEKLQQLKKEKESLTLVLERKRIQLELAEGGADEGIKIQTGRDQRRMTDLLSLRAAEEKIQKVERERKQREKETPQERENRRQQEVIIVSDAPFFKLSNEKLLEKLRKLKEESQSKSEEMKKVYKEYNCVSLEACLKEFEVNSKTLTPQARSNYKKALNYSRNQINIHLHSLEAERRGLVQLVQKDAKKIALSPHKQDRDQLMTQMKEIDKKLASLDHSRKPLQAPSSDIKDSGRVSLRQDIGVKQRPLQKLKKKTQNSVNQDTIQKIEQEIIELKNRLDEVSPSLRFQVSDQSPQDQDGSPVRIHFNTGQ